MINVVEKFLDKYDFLDSSKTFLVGFSGGADSTCLLDILYKLSEKYKFKLVACHLNHNWRGEKALLDLKFCKNFTNARNIEFVEKTLSKDEKHTETIARELRYKFFEECIEKYNADGLFLAHNKNDNAETLLYRIIKGTGIKGLCAIRENRDKFYRPLLTVERSEIEDYCGLHKLEFVTDNTNFDNSYNRNYLRNEILPKFAKINKDYIKSLSSLAKLAEDDESLIEEYLSLIHKSVLVDDKILTKKFLELSGALQKRIVLDIFLKLDLDYSSKRVSEILNFIKENSTLNCGSKTSLNNHLWLFVSSENIEIISKNEKVLEEIQVEKEGIYNFQDFIFEIKKFDQKFSTVFPKDEDCMAYIEINEPINFTLRTRREGDFIYPLGVNGEMKLKKYLNAKKIINHKKDELLFLTKNSEILWAPSLGISEKFKVVKKPTHVLLLKKRH